MLIFSCKNIWRITYHSARKYIPILNRYYGSKKEIILGIETSCDDTGCAIVDTQGNILGEALKSQHIIHLNNGGIIPPIAQELHRKHIENVVDEAVKASGINLKDINAIATTVKPGLALSLIIGMNYGKHLCREHNKPFMPIHHMEAHALTARMYDKSIEFPFLVLLISGGHCLIAVAEKVDKFLLLGETIDHAPGEAFDKIARRLKLRNCSDYSNLSGGQAIELAASKADNPFQYNFSLPLQHYKSCNFSFAGIRAQTVRYVLKEEMEQDVPADGLIPGVNNLCASLLMVMTRHLCQRVERAMEYVRRKKIIPPDKQVLVVSGGVACNNFIAKGLQIVCDEIGYKLARPPPKLCTDNGVMIAWNGIERWKENIGIYEDFEDITVQNRCPLGENLIEDIEREDIRCKWVKLKALLE